MLVQSSNGNKAMIYGAGDFYNDTTKTELNTMKNEEISQVYDDGFWQSSSEDESVTEDYSSHLDDSWAGELKRLSKQLSLKIRATLTNNKLRIECKNEFILKLSEQLVESASKEPCGIKGCTVYLRLLHEDIAAALMTSSSHETTVTNSEKYAGWSGTNPERRASNTSLLDYENLPDLDVKLTRKFSPDCCSTDSGFGDAPFPRKRPDGGALPSLSAASVVGAPCADLGRVELDANIVPNFEIYVYLSPSVTWSWKIKKFFSKSISMEQAARPECPKRTKMVNLSADFTLVKKKLFRSRCNSKEVLRCTFSKE